MAKYSNNSKVVEISQLTEREMFNFFKLNIQLMIAFKQGEEVVDYLILHERTYKNDTNAVVVSGPNSTDKLITYARLIELVNEKNDHGVLTIQIDIETFKAKEPFIVFFDRMKQKISDVGTEQRINRSVYRSVDFQVGLTECQIDETVPG